MFKVIETTLHKRLTGFDGLALWPFIFMVDKSDLVLLEHEKVHIKQQLRGWLIGYAIKYLYYNWKYGYRDNPYEVEAREIASNQEII